MRCDMNLESARRPSHRIPNPVSRADDPDRLDFRIGLAVLRQMKPHASLVLILLGLFCGAPIVEAAPSGPATPDGSIHLYGQPPRMAGPSSSEIAETVFDSPGVRNVSDPTLTPVLPAPGRATGAAVIVLPGGGYRYLAIDTEGLRVAHYLADHGVTAFVLKYRLKPTPADRVAFMGQIITDLHAASRESAYMAYSDPEAVSDG